MLKKPTFKGKALKDIFATAATVGIIGVFGGGIFMGIDDAVGHTDVQGTTQALQHLGFHDIHTTGKGSMFTCGRDREWYRTNFTAVNANGVKETGTACRGFIAYPGVSLKFNN